MNKAKTTIFIFAALIIAVSAPAILLGDLKNCPTLLRYCIIAFSIVFFLFLPHLVRAISKQPKETEAIIPNPFFLSYTVVASFLLANSMVDGVILKCIITLFISAVLFIIPCCIKREIN